MRLLTRVALLTAVLFGVQTTMLGWSVFTALSALLTAFTLVLVREGFAARTRLAGFFTTAWMYWGLTYVSNLIEAVYFKVLPVRAALSSAAIGSLIALALAALLEAMTETDGSKPMRSVTLARGVWWRVPVLAFAFFVIYCAAGAAIYRWVASFYAHQQLPTLTELLRLQLCRGVFDLACIYPVFSQWKCARMPALWMSACAFTVLCGWAPLLLPNQFMPGPIRLAHAVEMGASGIVFGMLTAAVLLKRVPNASCL
jgi:hypothetical protein